MENSTVKLPQYIYDQLIVSLNRNAKALHDPGLTAWRKKLETSARTEADGVVVGAHYLNIISEELTRIVQKNGHKYGSGGDKLLIIEIAEALEAANYLPRAESVIPSPPVAPQGSYYEVDMGEGEEPLIVINPDWLDQIEPM